MKPSYFMRVLLCKFHCSSFICFCKPSASHLYTPGPLKLKNTKHVPSTVTLDGLYSETTEAKEENSDGLQETKGVLKSCIRKAPSKLGTPVEIEKKRVQWIDNLGKELFDIKEFEFCEAGDSNNEEDNRFCACVIL